MEYPSNDIRNIAFEAINSRFSRGKYLGVEVTIDMTNGYINGSHLVGQVPTKGNNSKQYSDWRRNKQAAEMLEFLSLEFPRVELLVDVGDAPNGLRGVYIHPALVPSLAQWASPTFARKVAVILQEHAISAVVAEKNRELKVKDDKIDELMKKVDKLLAHADRTEQSMEHIQVKLEDAEIERDTVTDILVDVQDQLTVTQAHLGVKQAQLAVAVERRVAPETYKTKEEIFALYSNGHGAYRAIRCQARSRAAAVARCARSGYTRLAYSKVDPNAISIFNKFKEQLPANIGQIQRVYDITLAAGATEADLLAFIHTIDDLRRVV
jgi:KilA-N domain/Protein of unknown function (DUF3627)